MSPTITTILASADKAAQRHAKVLEAHQAAHVQAARERGSQQAATATSGPAAYGPIR